MTDTATTVAATPHPGLAARLFGVNFSPRDTYAAIAARPRAWAAIFVIALLFVAAQQAFLATEVGRQVTLDMQIKMMESFGVTVSDQMYNQIEQGLDRGRALNAVATVVFLPLINGAFAGILMVVFTMLLGGAATFKHVNAILAHSGIILVLQQAFVLPLSYAREEMGGANLGVFVPFLEETAFLARLLGAIDLFMIWWMVSAAIGLGVLYRRRTGPIAIGLLTVYFSIALLLAIIRSGS
jgi:hypothetical protein